MLLTALRPCLGALLLALAWQSVMPVGASEHHALRRHIRYQRPNDIFYNYYVGPEPSGTAAQMYPSPLPVPPNVGHTYVPYPPLMPHEFLYRHKRTWYGHTPGSGWTRAKVRYHTGGQWIDWLTRPWL